MPLPVPKKSEEKQAFISRCMGNKLMNREYPDQDQRAGVCYSQWEKKHGEQKYRQRYEAEDVSQLYARMEDENMDAIERAAIAASESDR